MKGLSRRARWGTYLRSFTVQGSWNYRTFIGGGFGFAMLPVLRALYGPRGEALERALSRHLELFNAHPYLTGLALGASARLEAEEAPPDLVRRFKTALRGPLGGLGDNLVWAGWLPLTVLVALVTLLLGAEPWVVALVFLGLYNLGHLGLRTWAFEAGWRHGRAVGDWLRHARLSRWTEVVQGTATFLLGGLVGAVAVRGLTAGGFTAALAVGGLAGFGLGLRLGPAAWRPVALVVILAILTMTLFGMFR